MRTKEEQGVDRREDLRSIAEAIRALQECAKKAGEPTLAYLLDMAAMEAEARARVPRAN